MVIHHSDTDNTSSDWAAVVRSIWNYHTNTRGWGDIGYNYLIDPNGIIYEGRAGGDNVIGAHFSCQNDHTMGVCMLGTYDTVSPTAAALASLERLLAWKADEEGIDSLGSSYHPGTHLTLPNVCGHRDGNAAYPTYACTSTTCPGDYLYDLLPSIRIAVYNLINPTITITFETSPAGLQVTVDGTDYTTPKSFDWTPGSQHSSGAPSPQYFGLYSRYVFTGSQNQTITVPSSASTYTANFSTQYDLTVNASSGGSTSESGGWQDSGAVVSISAKADAGYSFSSWAGSGPGSYSGTDNLASVTMNGPIFETAHFTASPVTYTLTTSSSPGDGGKTSGDGTFDAGTLQTVKATANAGFTFVNWTEDGSVVSTSASYDFALKKDRNLVANFNANQVTYTITTSSSPSDGGTTSGEGTFKAGTSQAVKATPNAGYTFAEWTEDGSVVSNSATYKFTLNSDRNLVAHFAATPSVAMPVMSPNGGNFSNFVTVSLSCSNDGATIRYTTNGNNPTASSTLYGGTFTLTSSTVVKAYASETGYNDSTVASAVFTIVQATNSPPESYQFITLAGSTNAGSGNGMGTAAQFNSPLGLAADRVGNVYVADTYNDTIRRIARNGEVTTMAGLAGSPGYGNGEGNEASFLWPYGVAVDTDGIVYVADTYNDTIRKVTPGGVVATIAGSPQIPGSADGTGSTARFFQPNGLAVGTNGNIYVADTGNNTIRIVTPSGDVSTLAGQAGNNGSINGTGTNALFDTPTGIAVDGGGNIYVADSGNNTIREISISGCVTTFAGQPGKSGSMDGIGTNALFNRPTSVTVDNEGNVYVADTFNYLIRKIAPDGLVSTVGGSRGNYGYVDGIGTNALFGLPSAVAADRLGNIYVCDTENNVIRKGWAEGTPPGIVLGGLLITNNEIRIEFIIASGVATNFTLLQSPKLPGSWATNGSAILMTKVPGLSYIITVPLGSNTMQFYRLLSQ